MHFRIFPTAATDLAGRVDKLYLGLILISAFYLAIIFLPMIYFLFKYRRGHKADRTPLRIKTWKVEIVWTVIPFLMMMGLFGWAADLYFQIERPPAGALEATVVGKQWMWKIQHPEGNREINELHVPLRPDRQAHAGFGRCDPQFFYSGFSRQAGCGARSLCHRMVSSHARPALIIFFAPNTAARITPRWTGRFIVMEPAEYEDWLGVGRPADTLAASGEHLFRELGCSGCHMGSSIVTRRRWKDFMANRCR